MKPIPREAVREMHAALKEAETHLGAGNTITAEAQFLNLLARGLVTIMAAMTEERMAGSKPEET